MQHDIYSTLWKNIIVIPVILRIAIFLIFIINSTTTTTTFDDNNKI